jgi:tetratricopeptide (TPR) repeat protein
MTQLLFRLPILSFILALAAGPALAQQIQGQVRLAEGNRAAFNIPVECSGSGCSGYQYTDRNGKFSFRLSDTGQYTITITVPGYLTETRSVTLLDSSSNEYLFFTLKPDPKAAGASTNAAPAIDPKAPEPARKEYQAGLDEMNKGKAEKAIPHLEKAVSLYTEFQQAYLLLGMAYIDQKQWEKAESTLRHAVELDPKKADAYFALGDMYYQQKKYPEAEKALVEGLQIDDKSWQGHFTLAQVYVAANAFDKAAPHIEKANQIRPDYADAHILAANIYLKTRNAEGALKEFETYLQLAPKGKFAPQAQNAVTKLKEMLKK